MQFAFTRDDKNSEWTNSTDGYVQWTFGQNKNEIFINTYVRFLPAPEQHIFYLHWNVKRVKMKISITWPQQILFYSTMNTIYSMRYVCKRWILRFIFYFYFSFFGAIIKSKNSDEMYCVNVRVDSTLTLVKQMQLLLHCYMHAYLNT